MRLLLLLLLLLSPLLLLLLCSVGFAGSCSVFPIRFSACEPFVGCFELRLELARILLVR